MTVRDGTRTHETGSGALRPARLDEPGEDARLLRAGGRAGVAGAVLLLSSLVVVVALALPDASDVASLRDYASLREGRVAEHVLYLGALLAFMLQVAALGVLLRTSDRVTALFGSVTALSGLVIMAASSLLHVTTAPLAELHAAGGATAAELQAVEAAWTGTQGVFDTMLTTGALLVPLGLGVLGLAMRRSRTFGPQLGLVVVVLGAVGTLGALVGVVSPGSALVGVAVLSAAVVHLLVGLRQLRVASTLP